MRVATINIQDSDSDCPDGFIQSNQTCQSINNAGGCFPVIFPTNGVEYSHVCGQIRAFQFGGPNGFRPDSNPERENINGNYLDGISLTYRQGEERKHIWSFVATRSDEAVGFSSCPRECTGLSDSKNSPDIVDRDFFCESGADEELGGENNKRLFLDDPLWDGKGCTDRNRVLWLQ